MLGWLDYVIFALVLGVTIGFGIYFGFCGNTQKSPAEYLLGSKAMTPFPIAMSLIATIISGVLLVGIPADVYKYGASFIWLVLAIIFCSIISFYVYVPVFVKLESPSISQYLEIRFDRKIRILASVLYTIKLILYNPIVVYISSIVLSHATGFNNTIVSVVSSIICIFYTTIGGFKAVVWTDTVQAFAIYLCMFVIMCMGLSSTGGIINIWNKSNTGGRLDVFNFNVDFSDGTTFWAYVFGGTIFGLSDLAIGQGIMQRFMSLSSHTDTRKAMIILAIGYGLVMTLTIFCGLEIYAMYAECDPVLNKQVRSYDQMLPYFVQELSHNAPGLHGLFIAGIFSGALSTLSTTLNSLSAIIYSDFLSGFIPEHYTDHSRNIILKFIVLVMGVMCISLVFIVERLGGIIPLSITIGAVTGGPLLGIYTLGVVFPIANTKGVLWGGSIGLLFISWIVFGNQWYKLQGLTVDVTKPFVSDGCNSFNNTTVFHPISTEEPFVMYRISYWYYTCLGAIPVIIIGLLVSWLTRDKDTDVPPHLISPIFQFLLKNKKTKAKTEEYPNNSFRLETI